MHAWIRRVLIAICVLFQLSCSVWSLPKLCPKFDVLYGRTRSRSRGRAMRVTCSRGYNLIGERTLLCNKGKWDSDVPVCARTGCPIPDARIPGGKVLASNRDQLLRTVCEDGFELQGSAVIFCNGIVWNDTLPLCVGKPGVKACDFEGRDHFCGWHQTRNMLGWRMGYDPLENWVSNWAPDFDHTYGLGSFGHYVHMVGPTDEHPFYTSGQLKSPYYRKPENPQVCFQFWFHVFGEEAGDLKVMVNREVLWSKEQINRKLWQRGAFHFVANSTYQIIIEASVPHSMVTVAVDDLEVIENCTHEPEHVLGSASSCEGRCGDDGTVDDCSCDSYCQEVDNCCPDLAYFCPSSSYGLDTTTTVSETTVVASNYSPEAITTIIPDDVQAITNPLAESTLNQNISEQTINQGQSEENNNIDSNLNTMTANQASKNIEKINEQVDQTITLTTPGEERNKTYDNDKTGDILNGTVSHNDLYLSTNVNEEIDVPVESPNETTTDQMSETSEGINSTKKSIILVKTNQEVSKLDDIDSSGTMDQNVTQGNETPVSMDVNDTEFYSKNQTEDSMSNVTAYDQTAYEHRGLSLQPNLPINKKRMRESVKKSTVVYDAEETQLNPTKNKTSETVQNQFAGNGTEGITPPSPVLDKTQTKIDFITIQNTTARNEDQTLFQQRNITVNYRTIDNGTTVVNLNNTTENTSLINSEKLEKEKADIIDIIRTKDSNTELKRADLEPSNENILNILKNEGNDNETTTQKKNDTSPNIETPANNYNLNRNYTKIILYKSSNNDNSTNTIASNALHVNDISRVQIHTNTQVNGVPFVENVNKNDMGKYNKSTIARLKQINDHINNVIAKRNTTNAGNETSDGIDSKNATVLHKLKHFITTIIDSHNNSTLMTNNTENMEQISNVSNVNLTENNEGPEKSTMHATRDVSTSGSVSSDGLILLTEKTLSDSEKTQQITVKHVNSNKTNISSSGFGEFVPGVSNIETQELPSVIRPEQNVTWYSLDTNNNKYSENYKLVRSYNEKTKIDDKLGNTSGVMDSLKNSSVVNMFENIQNISSGNISSVLKDYHTTNAPTLPTKSTPIQISSSIKKYYVNIPAIRPKPKFTVTKSIRFKPATTIWKSVPKPAFQKPNSSVAKSTLRGGTYKPIKSLFNFTIPQRNMTSSDWFANWRLRRLSTTTERSLEVSSTSRTTPSGDVNVFSINLLKTMSNNSAGNRKVDQAYKYEVWEETTEDHIHISASSSKIDNPGGSSHQTSLTSILGLLLIVSAVIGSSVTSYYLVGKYRRPRPDDTEIAYLTGDELLYFRTPSPHRSAHRNARTDNEDDVGTF